ncbi:MAG: GNAT family N-acetyltransferase [Tatlockia sp.]|nr:GNAT family N-acetyltransferase [Tatlockia sp.]
MTLQLTFENPDPDDIQLLSDGIMNNARQKKGLKPIDFFSCFIRDKDSTILGGCNGCLLYGSLHIDQLWVSENYRCQGLGSQLIKAALRFGKNKGCIFATVNTMDWEALGFYQKAGFIIEFERQGFLKDSKFYFLRLNFSS